MVWESTVEETDDEYDKSGIGGGKQNGRAVTTPLRVWILLFGWKYEA